MNTETFVILLKTYAPAIVAASFGALAHALENIKIAGWKGWFNFLSDFIICSFVGYSFFHLALVLFPSEEIKVVHVIFTSSGSFWGTKGFVLIREWVVNSIKANIK